MEVSETMGTFPNLMLRALRDECARGKRLVAGELIPSWRLVTCAVLAFVRCSRTLP